MEAFKKFFATLPPPTPAPTTAPTPPPGACEPGKKPWVVGGVTYCLTTQAPSK